MKAKHASFIVSAAAPRDFPRPELPEIAFAGRSNVGKSSLINRLLDTKGLARTSSRPGRTQSVNFYRVNDRFFLVDLPGFGYAKAPGPVRDSWKKLVEWYLSREEGPCGVVHLVDGRTGVRTRVENV